ncbi:hypothetical protein QBC40DRAFT_278107 [Triangularia verruculosa]|uniref:Uncharacterized protein n=1 Tax=Triangularia verruculosa TaxID=2587418 RepID=A0AAN7AW18_9PEZI|nr:hypothetical protein QBC40DRAFT_278107 [Triangularia verruculosa]
MVQTRSSAAAASRDSIAVKPLSISDFNSDSDASIPAIPRISVKSPNTLRPNKTPLATLNNEINNKKRPASSTLETPVRKRGRPRKVTDPEDEEELNMAAMKAVNSFSNRQTPKKNPQGIEVLLRSTGKPSSSRRRLDGTSINETIGETPQSTKAGRRPSPVVEDSEPEDEPSEEEEDIDNRNQSVNRELGSPELDSSPPKPRQQPRQQPSPARLQPTPAVLMPSSRPRTINNLRPPTPSKEQQHTSLDGQILPSVEGEDEDVSAYHADDNMSEMEEADEPDLDGGDDGRQEDDEGEEEPQEHEDSEEEEDVEDSEEDDTHFHPPINIHVPEMVDRRLIVTLDSEHLNSLRSLLGKEQWTDLGNFWELEIYGGDGFHFASESPPATSSGERCLEALYALRQCLEGLKSPGDLESQNENLIRLQNPLNRELTNVARKVAKLRQSLRQPGIEQQKVSGDAQQFVIPTLVLTLRDLFLLGTIDHKLKRHRALPLLAKIGTFTCVTVQYVTSITKRLASLVRDLMEYCEDEAAIVQLGWNGFSRVLDEWKFELQEKIGAVNEEMSRQEKIARDKAIKESKRRQQEIELAKFNEQWNRMAASTQAMKHQPSPMALKQRLTDQYISPPQESVSPPQSVPRRTSGRPCSSYIETAHAGPSRTQHHQLQAEVPQSRIRPSWKSGHRQVGLPHSSQHAPPPQAKEGRSRIHAPWQPRQQIDPPIQSTTRPSVQQHPARQLQSSSSPVVRRRVNNVMAIDSSPEPEPLAVPGHIVTPSRQARPRVEVEVEEVEEVEEQEAEDEVLGEDEGTADAADEDEEEDDDDEEAFGRVWLDSEKDFLVEELEKIVSQGITKRDLEDCADCLDCSVSEIRRQIVLLQREGRWHGSL